MTQRRSFPSAHTTKTALCGAPGNSGNLKAHHREEVSGLTRRGWESYKKGRAPSGDPYVTPQSGEARLESQRSCPFNDTLREF